MNALLISIMLGISVGSPQDQLALDEARSAQAPELAIGEIIGDSVNVRSGPSTNYYAVTKMHRGDRVVIQDHKHGWLGIKPPKGCFSLVTKQYVDLDLDGKTGVINGRHVWVHVGSELENKTYAKQPPTLDRGKLVQVIGEQGEFYKIVPPKNRVVWVSADYVEMIQEGVSPIAAKEFVTAKPRTAPQTGPKSAPAVTGKGGAAPNGQEAIDAIEVEFDKELEKNIVERDYTPFIKQFKQIAGRQDVQPEIQQYAAYRATQLKKAADHAEALREVRDLSTRMKAEREEFMNKRANIRPRALPMGREFDVRGKFVKSFAYDNPAGPNRFRILDPRGESERTIAYVEIEPHSKIDPEAFLGRIVGVRAKSHRLVAGTVDQMVVYIAAEIVILERADTQRGAEPQP